MDIKEEFSCEFYKACESIRTNYPSKEDDEGNIVGTIIIQLLHEIQHDAEKMSFIEFYKKYIKGSLFLGCEDFTASQIKEIIEESTLIERDKKLARYYWLEMMSEEMIANELQVDRKTVRNNIPKISVILKATASKIYK